ncbi:hypothetical protein [Xenorhabdus griffiniae]|uniref:hypothetical protein n=1 Tax=Xenorhabdus griffiniae TaxID=351672 RepID=UPI0023588882|nr:hypothetical protein [Xenorhabdus griffiniae]MDC9603944.1 hypothetical protein [Xenorhabdus griffiniae]
MEKIYVIKIETVGGHFFDDIVSSKIVSGWPDVNYNPGDILIIREHFYKCFTGRNLLAKIIRVEKSSSSVLLRFECINPAEFFYPEADNGQ